MDPPNPVENNSAVFRCEVKIGGPPMEQIFRDDLPYLTLFYADYPTQKLLSVGGNSSEENVVIEVSSKRSKQIYEKCKAKKFQELVVNCINLFLLLTSRSEGLIIKM